ncbi:MAG TPA: hypothetical protein VFU54_16040 [Actinomycetota bacterium]|nr:hypothetical protein [Actinomycetota bacterium]
MEERPAVVLWCPGCLHPVGEAARCPACGLRQDGADAARLRVVVHRLYELGEAQQALAAEMASLRLEQGRLLGALAPQEPALPGMEPPAAARTTLEWRPGVVRGVLLGLGAVLVALAAFIFSVVAWVNLGDAGRAGLLVGATLVAAAIAAAARRRLPVTAEAFGGLALALALVDWYAVRRAGVAGSWSATAWWALGTGAGAAVAAGAGRWLAWQRLAAVLLAQAAAVLVVATVADAPWTVGAGLALAGAAATGGSATLATRRGWRHGAIALAAGAALLELAALGAVLESPSVHDLATAAGPAAALAAVALAPAVARATFTFPFAVTAGPHAGPGRREGPLADVLVAAVAGALLAAGGTLLAAVWASWALLAAVAVLGAAAVGVGRGLPAALRRGTTLAAGATLAVGMVGLLGPLLRALAVPLAWASDPWTAGMRGGAAAPPGFDGGVDGVGAAILALLAGAVAAALAAATRPGPRLLAPRLGGTAAAAAGVGVVAVLPVAAGWPLWAALPATATGALAAGAAAVLADRRTRPDAAPSAAVAAGCAVVLVVLAACWALATEAGTMAFLGVLVPAAAVGAAASRTPWLRGGLTAAGALAVLGETAAVVLGNGGDAAAAGVATVVAAGAVLVAGVRWRHGTAEGAVLEPLGLGGQVLGVLLAVPEERWLAVALTAAVPALLLAGVRRPRLTELQLTGGGYLWTGAATALAATWAWLTVAQVTLPEAYTLPAAALALAAGVAARRDRPQLSSWLGLGPGLAVALLPSLAVAVGGAGGAARPLLLTGAALLVVLAGARARLQAPLVLGGVTLLVLGADAVAPVAAQLPRWVTIGAAGLLLLWLGATAERRLNRLRELRQQFKES